MAVIKRRTTSPPRTWQMNVDSVRTAHERVYRRTGVRDLTSIATTFQASSREIGELFGVSRQAVEQWTEAGVPPNRLAEVGRVADIARRLRRTFKRERLPSIVRQSNPSLAGRTVLETLAEGGGDRVTEALDRLTSYVPTP